MPTSLCPDCSRPMAPRAERCDACGWIVPQSKAAHPVHEDRQHNRCAWVSNGMRCRYVGSMSHSTIGAPDWYCSGHFQARGTGDISLGDRIVQESFGAVAADADYSAAAIALATRQRFLSTPIATLYDKPATQASLPVKREIPLKLKGILGARPAMTPHEEAARRELLLQQALELAEKRQPLGIRE